MEHLVRSYKSSSSKSISSPPPIYIYICIYVYVYIYIYIYICKNLVRVIFGCSLVHLPLLHDPFRHRMTPIYLLVEINAGLFAGKQKGSFFFSPSWRNEPVSFIQVLIHFYVSRGDVLYWIFFFLAGVVFCFLRIKPEIAFCKHSANTVRTKTYWKIVYINTLKRENVSMI